MVANVKSAPLARKGGSSCIVPIADKPFYTIKLVIGDVGTYAISPANIWRADKIRANRKDIAHLLRIGSPDIADRPVPIRPRRCRENAGPRIDARAPSGCGSKMIKYLAFSLALALTAASAQVVRPGALPVASNLVRVGLVDEPNQPVSLEETCKDVSFTRSVKYGDADENVLDVATTENKAGESRPVLLIVAGQHFASDDAAPTPNPVEDEAMCLAARHGMVGVHVKYRLAPANPWPAGARDVSAAISWVHQNADLFKGDAQAIIAVGWSVGAFHLASYLAHPEFQEADNYIAGTVLVSGIYHADADIGEGVKSYLGTDASKYGERSAFPGILKIEDPIVLAWSTDDPPHLVAQAATLKDKLCGVGHCPRIAVLKDRDSPASVFGLDGTGDSLAERTQQLLSQIEARGLP